MNLPTVARTKCQLKLWLELKITFPTLDRFVSKYLSAMGSAIALERVVSRLNVTADDLQNKLLPSHIKMLICMRSLEHTIWFGEV